MTGVISEPNPRHLPSIEFASVRISKSQQWRRATRAELRAIVAEEAAKESVEVEYGKVEDARSR
jgi:hypothetical protein